MASPTENGAGDPVKAHKATSKKHTIEKTYQKKCQLEHILLRPDTYIGSVEKLTETMWVYDTQTDMIVQKQIEYVPGLYKIFDEVLVNAADNKQRDPKMNCIKIEINAESNTISVWNDGKGIPVVMHKEEKMYVPTMIFGYLLTSSNYNNEEEKVTGGRKEYGAKLCNIFSTKFTVETACKEYKNQYKQTWGSNMTKASDPKVTDFHGEDFTKITFSPDLAKFKMDKLDDDIVALMSRRAYDIAASLLGVKVFLNGKKVPDNNFINYIDLFIKGKEDDTGGQLKVVHEIVNDHWEVAMTLSDRGFQQMSLVNNIATTTGGRHVDYIVDMIVKQLIEMLKNKNKDGVAIEPFHIKTHMWIFINCLIVNPTFDSQTKEKMTLQMKKFGPECNLSEKFFTQVTKSGIVESVLSWAEFKAQTDLAKTSGRKQVQLKGIPKLEDAKEAGTKNAFKCTLILTEGDSAKSLAVAGLGVIGRDHYGVFPLRGKLLNVREATPNQKILESAEIKNLIKILGLQKKKKYNSEDDMKTLRYGKVMIMTDRNQEGCYIKGLLINLIHYNWPELLRQNFLEEFITPVVTVKKKNEELSFYSMPEFIMWKANTANYHTYSIKYYKGLGTSTSKEAKEYFTNIARHQISFRYQGKEDDDHIALVFSREQVAERKEWLTNFMKERRRRKDLGLPEKYLYTKDTKHVTYADFVNRELVLASNADNIRSIPSLVDGLKPCQRKVMFTCFERDDKEGVKVIRLAASVMEMSAYHQREGSVSMTIVNMAQKFVGSNNINLLQPLGQFGTRLMGGKDSASARNIFTKMSPLTRLIFHPNDDPLLKHEFDDNQKIEPVFYVPILPMVLVNGAEGIGTGWKAKIPNYNPREIVKNILRMLEGKEPEDMTPWYKNFKGTIVDCGDQRYVVSGEIAMIGQNKLEITELPVGTWTQNYKENVLEPLMHGSKAVLSEYKEYNTDTTVKFIITPLAGEMENMQREGLHKIFKLQSVINNTSMSVFDEHGCIKTFDSVLDILKEYYTLRLTMYQKRKDFMEGMLEAEAAKLNENVNENNERKAIEELIKRGYAPDPIKEYKILNNVEEEGEENGEREAAETSAKKRPVDLENEFKNSSDLQKFHYLFGISRWMLTDEKKNELLRQRDNKLAELDALKAKSKADLWREDLDVFMEKYNEIEEKERLDELGIKSSKKYKGKKKVNLKQETMPSPMAQRIVPTIPEDLKKRIQNAVKTKDNKGKKGAKKKNDEKDEFDMMVLNTKPLKDRVGAPEAERKGKAKKMSDGLELNFKKKVPKAKVKGKRRKRGRKSADSSDTETDDGSFKSESDNEFVDVATPSAKERVMSKRTATRIIKYDEESSDEEEELFENEAIKEENRPEKIHVSSDSENESPHPRHETSEDMSDTLAKRKIT